MSKLPKLRVTTYNIQASNNPKKIIHNIKQLMEEGVSAFCLQELRLKKGKPFIGDYLQKALGKNWKIHCFFYNDMMDKDLGICIMWNTDILQLKKIDQILLPQLVKKSTLEGLEERFMGAHRVLLRRKALLATFMFGKKTIRISNIHLDWQGGWEQRKMQLQFLNSYIQKQSACDIDIISGDFNTTKWPFPSHEEPEVAGILGKQFTNVSETIPYTSDLNSLSFYHWLNIIGDAFIKLVGFHCYQKVDHIWSRGLTPVHVEIQEKSGSDHFPLIGTFTLS